MQQISAAAMAMTERNANRPASVLYHLTIAWLRAEALDFEYARKRCEETLDSKVEANPFVFFFGRNLLAKACLGLHDYPAALAQFNEIKRRIEVDGVDMDCTIYPHFYHNLCEYCLEVGDLARAREQATRLYEVAAPPPERTYLALAHRLLVKIAIADGNFAEARVQLSQAISIVEHAELPLAAWRVYATAAHLTKATELRQLSRQVINVLSETLNHEDPFASVVARWLRIALETWAIGPRQLRNITRLYSWLLVFFVTEDT